MTNKEIKGNLARLLATENLVVEHKQTPTAYFNVDTRVLVLPKWDKASDVVYDMLVGHEVGHALFTPNVDFTEQVSCPRDYVNVIEDARIEKLMKRKYPGLKKSFVGGYTELNDKDFFQIFDKDLTELSLIDRINLHFKLGAHAMMPFEGAEYVFVARADLAETFDEVCKIAQDVYNYAKTQEEEKEKTEVPVSQTPSSTGGDTESDDEDGFGKLQVDIKGDRSGGSSTGADLEDVKDDWYDEDGNMTEPDDGESLDDLLDGEGDDNEGGIDSSATQQAFNEAQENLSSIDHGQPTTYVEIPENVDTSKHVVDWKTIHTWIDSQRDVRDDFTEVDDDYRKFRKQSQKEVNYFFLRLLTKLSVVIINISKVISYISLRVNPIMNCFPIYNMLRSVNILWYLNVSSWLTIVSRRKIFLCIIECLLCRRTLNTTFILFTFTFII